jgi:hypothetical protein
MKKLIFSVIFACLFVAVEAQLKTPAPSPPQTVKQDFGLASIELSYSRPGVKGRKILVILCLMDRCGAPVQILPLPLHLVMK